MYSRKHFKYYNPRFLYSSAENTNLTNQDSMPPLECSNPIKNLKTVLPQDPARELLDIDPKDSTFIIEVFSSVFTAALFIIARN